MSISQVKDNSDKEEISSLEVFILQDGGLYSFKEKRHHELFEHLLTDRLYNPQWVNKAQKIHLLVILQAIRLLTRDKTILKDHDIQQFCGAILDILDAHIIKKKY